MTSLPSFEELRRRADERAERVPVVVAGGDEPTVIEALAEAARHGWVRPILTGPIAKTAELIEFRGLEVHDFSVIDAHDPADAAVAMVHARNARILMKGHVATPDLMRAVLDHDWGLRTGRPIVQVVLMEIVRDGRRFLMTDTGVIPR